MNRNVTLLVAAQPLQSHAGGLWRVSVRLMQLFPDAYEPVQTREEAAKQASMLQLAPSKLIRDGTA